VLPFFALAPGGVGYSLKTQLERHLQVESLGSSILLAAAKLGAHKMNVIKDNLSYDLSGSLADAVGILSSVVAIALVLTVAWTYLRGPDDDARLVTAFVASIAAFTIFAKVLSPQYLTWLVPLVPLAAGRYGTRACVTFVAALALTMPEYLFWGKDGVINQDWKVWLLLLRNGLLVWTFWLLYRALREAPAVASPIGRFATVPGQPRLEPPSAG
jgi:hypothetical protein